MKAALLTGIREFEVGDVPAPEIVKATDVLVRIKTVGVCGSDVHYYTTGRIGAQVVEFPFVIGHEASGIVEAVGEKVTNVRVGQRIAIDPAVACGHCDQCRSERENTCRELLFLGCPKQLDGSLAEFVVTDERSCFPIDDAMTFDQATLSEPLAIGVYAVEKSNLRDGANVAVLGVGPVGMCVFHVLRTRDVGSVYVTDKIDRRLEFSKELNPKGTANPDNEDVVAKFAALEPLLMDVVYECSGDPEAIRQGIHLLKPGGTLAIVGIPEVDDVAFPIHELRRKDLTIVNIRRQANCTRKAIDLLASGEVKMDSMATHHFALGEIGDAFELVANYRDGVMKAMITL
ncbi:MAG: alcohol dehydrogenase catalytic domain-containing protein [Acidobacteria bacterium]|nr:alcohol dehydrogenase catalytic domain-containing protein [Acidobacteriota bacterium]